MKRHQSLYPLSRDHHHALVQARNLDIAAEANDPDGLKHAAERFARFWDSDLQWHFSQEERFVLPLLAKYQAPDSDEVRETLSQHTEIRRMVDELNNKLTRHALIEAHLLGAIGESLRNHVRFEENHLFPAVETAATEEELRRMNEQLEQDRSGTGLGGCALAPKIQAPE
ncbi:MAG TPA: hemerythrin domain-containing protein [Blastocatellia bacterium]|nr:hemerythrin domain-containing protein [Blastocatellia bacterium]